LTQLSAEWQLLLACARTRLTPAQQEAVAARVPAVTDWPGFLQLVDRQAVAPLVWRSLTGGRQVNLPEAVRVGLRQRVERNTHQALLLAAELARLVRRFEQAGIRVIPLKGPVLAVQLYGDLALRHAGDLDLLVDPQRFDEAEQIALELGYTRFLPSFTLSPAQAAAHRKAYYHSVYNHQELPITVELHWQWTENDQLFPLSFEDTWLRCGRLTIGGVALAVLPLDVLLLYLCTHGAKEEWCCLKWLCDLPIWLAVATADDLSRAATQARLLGVERPLAEGLQLAGDIFDILLPLPLHTLIPIDPVTTTLVRQSRQSLCEEQPFLRTPGFRQLWHVWYMLKLRPEFAYKRRCLYCMALRTEDYGLIPLPDWLFPLYFLLRPLIWACRQPLKRRQIARSHQQNG
jgi:hypothetical protein